MKKIIITLILLTTVFSNAQTKITGVITYYFNEYQGDKPDIGAKVYVIDSTKIALKDLKILNLYFKTKEIHNKLLELKNNYLLDSISYSIAKSSFSPKDADDYYIPRLKNIQSDINNVKFQFKKVGFENEREISYLDSKAKIIVENIKTNANITKTINAIGGYDCNLKNNKYFILIKSNNRNSLTSTETDGNLFFKSVNVGGQYEIDISYNFNIE